MPSSISHVYFFQGYLKAIKGKLSADEVTPFEARASAFVKKIVANFKDWEFVSCVSTTPVLRNLDLSI